MRRRGIFGNLLERGIQLERVVDGVNPWGFFPQPQSKLSRFK